VARHGDPTAPGVAGAVLAGGFSRRMGRDKALLPLDGRPLLITALEALRAAGCQPLRVGVRELPSPYDDLIDAQRAEAVADLRPGQGPLAGLEALLAECPAEWLLVVACDMPRLDPALLRTLVERRDAGLQAVVPRAAGRAQPLHALYHRDALAPIRAALDAGQRSATRLVERLRVAWVDMEDAASFTNVNEPGDLPE
jgi:molybdopterin-guanine dinucleotide biosynthesis protein A